jgi:hypothetical protein
MTASEGATERKTFGARFARAAAVFLEPRKLILLMGTMFLGANHRRELRLG